MKKHVLGYFCGTNSWGGLEMNQLRNALEMHKRGHDVVVISLEGSPLMKHANENDLKSIGVAEHSKYYDLVNARKLAKVIQDNKITHLIIRNPKDMSLAALTKTILRGKLHLSYFMEMQLGISKRDPLHTLRFRQFDVWSCPLNFLREQVIHFTRFPQNRIVIIPSGLNLDRFSVEISPDESRTKLELPQAGKIIGIIGRFDPQKGQLLLLQAFQQLIAGLSDGQPVYLAMMGEKTVGEATEYFDQIQQFIKSNELTEKVFIIPFRKDVETFYAAIDIFVMASSNETFGMVTIEALAAGKQIIGSNAGGTSEILDFNRLGRLFEANNPNDLFDKLQQLVFDSHRLDNRILMDAAKKYDFNSVLPLVEKALGID